ncbi:sarcosine oxidase subunit gamma [Leisingera sp. ANG-M1]|uniref:sarcosine oxidase subunit gamma n=1 Tax=Leisingera sp. ANG-M1 TaxID=1577895 RepID=UPI00057E7113|nr:sarcosine oxidase subunit gamma [Leisingera sp. ANG-M1]KIC07625.1 sarcosine oxidase subunit gamma [Leisingera sp. ANG-M1]
MSYDVQIKRHGLHALFDLKGAAADVWDWAGGTLPAQPERPNSRTVKGELDLFYIGRNHWILRAPIEQEEALAAALKPVDCRPDISIVLVSDTLTFFTVIGPQAADVMAVASPLDLHPRQFAEDAVTYTEIFGLKALVQCCGGGFEFAVEQSFGNLVVDYLARTTA